MKQTCILYGDPLGQQVVISHCVTERFSQEAVPDPSGTDLMYHKFRVVVTGFVTGADQFLNSDGSMANGVVGGLMNVGTGGDPYNPARQQVSFRSFLLEPRKHFEMRAGCDFDTANSTTRTHPRGGTTLLKADPYPSTGNAAVWQSLAPASPTFMQAGDTGSVTYADRGGYDLNNGPRCVSCDVLQVIGNQFFRVRAEFEICKLECDENGQALANTKGVLSNRWSVSDDVDENFLTTRRFRGLLRVSTAYLNANEFRSWVVPQLQAGFYRRSMSFHVSESGLELSYEVVDQETVWAAPGGATKWLVTHTETNQTDAIQVADIVCQLWGDRNTTLNTLLKIAIAVVHAKANPQIGINKGAFPEVMLHTEAGTNQHTVRVQWRVTRGVLKKNMAGVTIEGLGTPLDVTHPEILATPELSGYDLALSRGARAGDSVELSGPLSIAKAWRSFLQSPCDEDHRIALTADAIPESPSPATTVSVAVVPDGVIPTVDSNWINPDHEEKPYMVWEMNSRYLSNENGIMLGVAHGVANATTTDSPTAVFGRLGPTTTKRVIEITGTRIGEEPQMPDVPTSYQYGGVGTNKVARLLNKSIASQPPDRTGDGQQIYKIAVSLTYGLSHPPNDADKMLVGFNPWEYPLQNYAIPPATRIFNGPNIGAS